MASAPVQGTLSHVQLTGELGERHRRFDELSHIIYNTLSGVTDRAHGLVNDHKTFRARLEKTLEALEHARGNVSDQPLKVGLLGPSAAGKSSLLNTLVRQQGLSRTDAGAEGCTSAVWEVTCGEPEQDCKYLVQVFYYNEEETRATLAEFLQAFDLYHSQQDEIEDDEMQNLVQLVETLLQMTKCLFPAHDWCHTEAALGMALNDRFEGIDACTNFFLAESCRLVAKALEDGPDNQHIVQFDELQEVCDYIEPLGSTQQAVAKTPMLWPLVKRIRVSVKGEQGLRNMILADLPGISDINQCRERNCRNYLKDCDFLIIVAPITIRIMSDSTISKIRTEFGKRFENRILYVVTNIDAYLSPTDVQNLTRSLRAKRLQDANAMINARVAAEREVTRLKRAIRSKGVSATDKEQMRNEKRIAAQRSVDAATKMRCISLRTGFMDKGIHDPIHFVSNEHYWMHLHNEELDDEDQLPLSSEMTGVDKVRDFLVSQCTSARSIQMQTYCSRARSTLFAAFAAVRQQAPRDPVQLKVVMDAFASDLQRIDTNRLLQQPLYSRLTAVIRTTRSRLIKKARIRIQEWHTWAHASKKAFIRRYGKHSTRAKGERDWNHELATPALSVISDAFERTIAAVCDELRRSETLTLGRLDALAAKIQQDNDQFNIDIPSMERVLYNQKKCISAQYHTARATVKKELLNVRIDAMAPRHSNLFYLKMRPVFEILQDISGAGYGNRVTEHLLKVTTENYDNVFEKWFVEITNEVHQQLTRILQALSHSLLLEAERLCNLMSYEFDKGEACHNAEKAAVNFIGYATLTLDDVDGKLKELRKLSSGRFDEQDNDLVEGPEIGLD